MRAFRFCLITRESLPAGKRKTVKKAEKNPAIDGFIKNRLTNKRRCPALARYEICHLIRHYVNLILICIVSLIYKTMYTNIRSFTRSSWEYAADSCSFFPLSVSSAAGIRSSFSERSRKKSFFLILKMGNPDWNCPFNLFIMRFSGYEIHRVLLSKTVHFNRA